MIFKKQLEKEFEELRRVGKKKFKSFLKPESVSFDLSVLKRNENEKSYRTM